MKAKYKTIDNVAGTLEYAAIVPQPMQHIDGFTLLGFNSWEDVHDEKITAAITNVAEFALDKETGTLGFHGKDSN